MWAGNKPPKDYNTVTGASALAHPYDAMTSAQGATLGKISTDAYRSSIEVELQNRIEDLEKTVQILEELVNKLLLEVMPEYKV